MRKCSLPLWYALAVILAFSGCASGSQKAAPLNDFNPKTDLKVNVQMKDGWEKIYIWYDQHADGSWETSVIGDENTLLTDQNDGWHSRVFKDTAALTFLFNKGDWDDKLCDSDGADFSWSGGPGEIWITKDGLLRTAAAAGAGAAEESDPRDSAILFNSRDSRYKSPYGAVPRGTSVTWRFEAPDGYVEGAKLIIQKQVITGDRNISYIDYLSLPMTKTINTDKTWWEVQWQTADIQVYGYYFEITADGRTRYLGGDGKKVSVAHYKLPLTGGAATVSAALPREGQFIQTVYDPAFRTPEWAKDAIFYYIFPDRFRNGNPANDPVPGRTAFYSNKTVEFHSNWLDFKPWRPGSADGNTVDDAEWCNDFYGGDLAGITEKLDYIASLGANTLYLNPIFEAPSNHKYDTADYLKVDDGFGSLDDFKALTEAARGRGIRVILDASFNHSGSDSVYMDRYGKYEGLGAYENETIRTDSPWYDWYEFNPRAATADGKYGQWANPTLANLNENSPSLREFLFNGSDSVTRYWLKAGASGWRMDVTPWVTDSFWRDWRKAVKATDPQAYTVAETWWDSSKYLLGDMFDATMNYIFRQAVYDYVSGAKTAADSNNLLEMIRENYPKEAFDVLMNLLSTHDAARALHRFGYRENGGSGYEEAVKKLKLAFLMQMSYPGAPAIFYGDEVGLTGGDDPENRAPYPWADRGGKPDQNLREELTRLVKLRKDNPVLNRGSVEPLYTDEHCIIWLRTLGNQRALVALNNSATAQSVTVNLTGKEFGAVLKDLLDNSTHALNSGSLTISIPALWGRILR